MSKLLEAVPGLEPGITALQAVALSLGYTAPRDLARVADIAPKRLGTHSAQQPNGSPGHDIQQIGGGPCSCKGCAASDFDRN